MRVAGVDVGAPRKGFHAAIVDDARVTAGPTRLPSVGATVAWLARHRPALVAVDAPIEAGPRPCERELARRVCHLYYTPAVMTGDFYAWMRHASELYAALRNAGIVAVECFPTATWTRIGGPRGSRSRASWTTEIVAELGLAGVPERTNQDERDAIGAAFTAFLHARGRTESFGAIVVPSIESPDDRGVRSAPRS